MKLYQRMSFVLALLMTQFLLAQEGNLEGTLKDEKETSIPFATVAVVKLPDSTVVTGTTTDLDGLFELDAPEEGQYALRFSAIGFKTRFTKSFDVSSPDFSQNFGTVILPAEVTMLNEVMVETWRPRVELEAGKMVVRVEGTAMAAGSTAFEVVSKSPGITTDQDGELKMNGKNGVQVLINGRETYLSPAELKTFLESMPAENIKNIEIIHSPSAKYPAAGTAGIINITLKENVSLGFTGSVYGGAEFNNENWYNTGINLNYGKGKWNTFFSANVNKVGFDREQEAVREFTVEGEYDYFRQEGVQLEKRWVPSFRGGVDYQLDDKHMVGVTANYSFYNEGGFWNTETNLGTYPDGDLLNIVAKNSSDEDYENGRLNFHYTGKLDTIGTILTADLDFVKLDKDRASYFDNFYTYFEDDVDEVENLFNKSVSSYSIVAAKADLVLPFNDRSGMTMGIKGSSVISDSDLKFYIGDSGSRILDPNRSNSFRYEEEIYAAYVSYTNKFSETWDLQIGLRAEQTIGKGVSPTTGQTNERQYLNFFPNVQISQKVSENYELGYSFTRRIKRPDYSTLNPFLFYLDPYTYIVGNPELDASITSSYKVTQSLFGKYQLILGYDHTEGPMGEYPRLDEETSHTAFTTANLDESTSMFANFIVPIEIGSFWMMNNTLILNKENYQIAYGEEIIENDNFYYSLQSNNQFNLLWNVKMEINAAYNGPMVAGIYKIDSMWYTDVGLKKSFMEERLDVTLKAQDIFNGMQMHIIGEYPGSTFEARQHFYSQGVSINLRYKLKGAGKEKESRPNSLEELERAGG